METTEVVSLVASLIAVVAVVFLYWRSGKTLNFSDLQQAIQTGMSLASELEKVGLMAVASVEQLKENGTINTEEEAFNAAFDYIATWPGMDKLDRKIIAHAVEGAYRLYKEMTYGSS